MTIRSKAKLKQAVPKGKKKYFAALLGACHSDKDSSGQHS